MMVWGTLAVPYKIPASLNFALFALYGQNFPAYRGFMLLVSAGMLLAIWLLLKKTRIGLIIQASLTHPNMVAALGHDVPLVFTIVFAAGCALAGLAGVIGGNYFTTDPGMADALGPIVFVVVVFGGLGSLAGCFIASLIMGIVQTFAVMVNGSISSVFAEAGFHVGGDTLLGEVLSLPLARIGPLLPYLLMILILFFRPRGLMGTRDT
jgi:branched-chain amino acid transport system permease protein